MYSKFAMVFLGLALLICPVWAEWVALNRTDAEGTSPQIQVVVSDEEHIVLEVNLTGFYRELDMTNLWKLNIPGAATMDRLGQSALPVVTGIIALPNDAIGVKVADYQILQSSEFKGMQVYPFQKPTTDDNNSEGFSKDETHYLSAESFPTQCLTLEAISVWRNKKVVSFRLVPIQVIPSQEVVFVNNKVRFTINYEKGRTDFQDVTATPVFERLHQSMLLNYTPGSVPRDKGKYLVISEDTLASAVQPLVDFRKGQGYGVSLVNLSQIGTQPQNIKDYLTQQYSQGLAYVLLVGDHAKLPMYIWSNNPSDYWYSCLAGNDMYADVALGRICANNTGEVEVYVRKIIAYESQSTNGDDWAVTTLLTSHKEGAPGKYEGCLEEMKKASYSYKIKFITRHGSQSTSNNSVVKSDIDAGVALVTYRGHGSTTSWSGWNGTSFTTDNMKSLNNAIYPVFYSIACYNSQLDSSSETLAESCVKHPYGGGCAFLGATRPSYTIPNHDFCKFLYAATYISGIATIGDISNSANMELLKKYGASSYAAENVKMYLWLGDPATVLHLVK